jgi:iron complex outermembrane receptor protein
LSAVRRISVIGVFVLALFSPCLGSDKSSDRNPDKSPQDCPSVSGRAAGSAAQKQDAENCAQIEHKKIQHKETVVVTGTYAPTPVEDVDRSVTVVDTKEAPLLYNNWVNYLQMDPSVDLQQRAPGDVQADLTIRGSTFGQTLVMLDGLRMNDAQSGHHNMDLPLPTSAIDRIEILRGAGSTLYGSDAMGGSINVIVAPPKYSDFRFGSAIGNFGVNQEYGSASWLDGRFDEELDASRDFSSGFIPDRDYRSLTTFSSTGLQTSLGRSLLMLGYGDKPFGADQFYGNFNSWERTKSWFAGFKQDLGRKTEADFSYRRHSDEFVLLRDDPAVYENNHIAESWEIAIRRHEQLASNIALFYGGEGFHESINSNNLGQHERSRGAGYIDLDIRAWKRFSFSFGAREEFYSETNDQFSPTISAGVWLKAGWKLKGSVGRAFRLPTYTDLYYSDPATVGNPNLQPETAWSYEGGLQWDQGGRFMADVTVFQRREANDIDYIKSSPTDLWHAENIARIHFTGAETAITFRLPREQRLQVAYTGLYGAQKALNGLESEYVFNYPEHDAFVAWQGMLPMRIQARTRIGALARYQRDPYALWDASLARQFNHVAAHLSLANLTNTGYEEIPGVIMPGRSVIFGLEFSLAKK